MSVNKINDYIEQAQIAMQRQRQFSPLMCNILRDEFIDYLCNFYQCEVAKTGGAFDKVTARQLCSNLVDAINQPKEKTYAIMIMGGVGTGKSTLLRALRNLLLLAINDGLSVPRPSPIVNARNLVDAIPNKVYTTFIDDVGTEAAEVMSFGNMRKPFREWVEACYDHHFTFIFTTNLNAQSMRERYGDRVYDRLKEMCAIVTAKGVSYRGRQ